MHDTDTPPLLHPGEIEAQRRFHGGPTWDGARLAAMLRDRLTPALASFLESQPFFFLATANARGECDCSFRGRESNVSGEPYPLLRVQDERTLVFPDFSGNRLYNSLGNILANPHVGLLFVDFQQRTRMRVNGRACIVEEAAAYASVWPTAQRYVVVTVAQAYPNCRARIPRMTLAPQADAWQDE